MYLPRNTLLPLAENLKANVKTVPIITVGGILDPIEADRIISEGKADMIVVGRAILADPEWAIKAKEGGRIRPCIRCNICHHEVAALGREMVCTVNPHLTHEPEAHITPTLSPKRIMVVGGGPAGIVASLILSRKGHDVTLFEEKGQIGGLLIPGSAPEIKQDLRILLNYYRAEVHNSHVKLQVNTRVTPDLVKQNSPDVLIVAVGARPIRPSIPGVDYEHVITAMTALTEPGRIKGGNVVVLGGGEVGCETAIELSRKGKRVVIVEMLDRLLPLAEIRNNIVVLEQLLGEANVPTYTGSKVAEITSRDVEITDHTGKTTRIPADTVVLALGVSSDKRGAKELQESCSKSYLVGDCVEPRRIFEAVHEAGRIAMQI
jgi:2-enoate reductase